MRGTGFNKDVYDRNLFMAIYFLFHVWDFFFGYLGFTFTFSVDIVMTYE